MAIFLGRELGERIKRLNVFNTALDAAPLGPSTSFHPSPPPQNFLCTLDASKLFRLLCSFQGFTSESHEFFMCCIKNLGNILFRLQF